MYGAAIGGVTAGVGYGIGKGIKPFNKWNAQRKYNRRVVYEYKDAGFSFKDDPQDAGTGICSKKSMQKIGERKGSNYGLDDYDSFDPDPSNDWLKLSDIKEVVTKGGLNSQKMSGMNYENAKVFGEDISNNKHTMIAKNIISESKNIKHAVILKKVTIRANKRVILNVADPNGFNYNIRFKIEWVTPVFRLW